MPCDHLSQYVSVYLLVEIGCQIDLTDTFKDWKSHLHFHHLKQYSVHKYLLASCFIYWYAFQETEVHPPHLPEP